MLMNANNVIFNVSNAMDQMTITVLIAMIMLTLILMEIKLVIVIHIIIIHILKIFSKIVQNAMIAASCAMEQTTIIVLPANLIMQL